MVAQARARGLDRPARARPGSPAAAPERSSACTNWPSRMRSRRISGPSSNNTATPCSSSRGRPRCWTGASPSARPTCSSGSGYVVSVRHGASTSYTPVRERCEAAPKALSEGEDFILYAILDFIVDNYMPVIETIQDEVEEIEDSILGETVNPDSRDAAVSAPARSPAPAQCRRPAGRGLPAPRAAGAAGDRCRHVTRSSATSPTTSAGCRRRSSPCARCWPSPSRPA